MPTGLNSELVREIHRDYIEKNFPSGHNNTINPQDLEILSTIRYDPNLSSVSPLTCDDITPQNFFLLPEHTSRLQFSMNFFHLLFGTTPDFEITESFLYKQLVQAMRKLKKSVLCSYKVRGLFKLDGSVTFELYEVPGRHNLLSGIFPDLGTFPEELEFLSHPYDEDGEDVNWKVYISDSPTLISPFTSFKTTKREVYNEARKLLPGTNPGQEEVVLFNTQNNVMEGSITNIAVKRESDGKWVTPLLSSGCLCGVTRHFLLRKNFIEEDNVTLEQLKPGTKVLLMNAIMGVFGGTIVG